MAHDLCCVALQLAQVLDALVQEAASVQKHKPQLHSLFAQDMPAAMADITGSSPSLVAASDAAATTAQAVQMAVAGSTAAALTALGSVGGIDRSLSSAIKGAGSAAGGVCGDPIGGSTPSGGGLGNKLLGVLLGRKNSAGPADFGPAADRVLINSGSRASGEWSHTGTPSAAAAAVAANVSGWPGLSRVGSDTAACCDGITGATAVAGDGSRQQTGSCSDSRERVPPVQGSSVRVQQLATTVIDGAVPALFALEEADEMRGSDDPECLGTDSLKEPDAQIMAHGNSGNASAAQSASLLATSAGAIAGPGDCGAARLASLTNVEGKAGGVVAVDIAVGTRTRLSVPGQVAGKLDAVKELLHKLAQDHHGGHS